MSDSGPDGAPLSILVAAPAADAELAEHRLEAAEQDRLASFVIRRLVDTERLRDPDLRWAIHPAGRFSGDLICAARGPGDLSYLLLADAAGHGLAAALSALPLPLVFHSMAAKGFSLRSIAEELNRKLRALLPVDRFVAATLAVVDTRNSVVEVWNGGNPAACLVTDDGNVAMRWPSRHPPLGVLPEARFSGLAESFRYAHAGDLLLCSDGLIEAEDDAGLPLGGNRLVALVAGNPAERRAAALSAMIDALLAGRVPRDDLSWLLARVDRRPQAAPPTQRASTDSDDPVSEWRAEFCWSSGQLRSVDVVPAVLRLAGEVAPLRPHLGALHVVLSELFNNALEHGLLGLDSRIKREPGGFERYLAEREQALAELRHGRIDLRLRLKPARAGPFLEIVVEDSGAGFDFPVFTDPLEGRAARPYGRGIELVCRLCAEVRYFGNGSRVRVRYRL